MGLVDDLEAIKPSNHRGSKKLLWDRLRDELTEEELAAFDAALEDADRVSAPQLAEVMRKAGHNVAASTIRGWRRGEARPSE